MITSETRCLSAVMPREGPCGRPAVSYARHRLQPDLPAYYVPLCRQHRAVWARRGWLEVRP